ALPISIFWCQLFSALNDNFLKNALVIIILYHTTTGQSGALVTLAGGLLVAPFLVFSALGGELADKYDKAIVARRLKLAEVPIAGIAAVGFLLHSVPLLFLARSEEHTSELQSRENIVCRLLLEKK